eukprot:scaffold46236_cov26-Tisochrysis_lutea.AAC.6
MLAEHAMQIVRCYRTTGGSPREWVTVAMEAVVLASRLRPFTQRLPAGGWRRPWPGASSCTSTPSAAPPCHTASACPRHARARTHT